jgi:RNA-directed DNA polymerase
MPVEGRGLSSRQTQQVERDLEIGQPINSEKCPETADGVTRESEGRSRLSLLCLYDKISREDILAYAYAQCRSNKGAPGVDGQDFADIEAYGVERWLGELALALRKETYRPEPIRRVFIPKANGKLRPLGIATVRDRVCMTVLVPRGGFEPPTRGFSVRCSTN